MKPTLYDIHTKDLVLVHGRLYSVVMVRGDWVIVQDVRHDTARFHISDVEFAGRFA